MKLSKIIDIIEGIVIYGDHLLDKDIIKCGGSDLMSDILAGESENSLLLTGLTTLQVIKTCIIAEISAIVFIRGKKPGEDVINIAKEENIPLISTKFSMFVSCGRLHSNGLTGLDSNR